MPVIVKLRFEVSSMRCRQGPLRAAGDAKDAAQVVHILQALRPQPLMEVGGGHPPHLGIWLPTYRALGYTPRPGDALSYPEVRSSVLWPATISPRRTT